MNHNLVCNCLEHLFYIWFLQNQCDHTPFIHKPLLMLLNPFTDISWLVFILMKTYTERQKCQRLVNHITKWYGPNTKKERRLWKSDQYHKRIVSFNTVLHARKVVYYLYETKQGNYSMCQLYKLIFLFYNQRC